MQANIPFEIQLKNNFAKIDHVTISNGKKIIPFKKADGHSYFRFAGKEGKYTFSTTSERGSFEIEKYKGSNLLFKRGAVRVSDNKKYLTYADSSPFFYLADTIWYGFTNRISDKEFKEYLSTRKKQGFTAVQIVIGVPPEIPFFSKEAHNKAGHPFLNNYQPNLHYFDELDKRIEEIIKHDLLPVLFGGWGHHIDVIGTGATKKFWKEIIARYSAYPVMFALTGEVEVFLNGFPQMQSSFVNKVSKIMSSNVLNRIRETKHRLFSKDNNKSLLTRRLKKWRAVGDYVNKINSYKRPITIHVSEKINASKTLNANFLDIDSIQSGHSMNGLDFMEQAISNSKSLIINLEPWYEGILGNFKGKYQRLAFWACILSGAKGHSYGAHGVWQIAQKDNFMSHWGNSNYYRAMKFNGAIQIGKAKHFLEKLDWYNISPNKSLLKNVKISNSARYYVGKINAESYILYFWNAKGAFELSKNSLQSTLKWYNPIDLTFTSEVNVKKENSVKIPSGNHDAIAILTFKKEN